MLFSESVELGSYYGLSSQTNSPDCTPSWPMDQNSPQPVIQIVLDNVYDVSSGTNIAPANDWIINAIAIAI